MHIYQQERIFKIYCYMTEEQSRLQNNMCSRIPCGYIYFHGKQSRRMNIKTLVTTSLVARWLRIRLPMQGTQVQALVREDPTWPWNDWARAPQLLSPSSGAHEPQLLKPARLEPVFRNGRGHAVRSPCTARSGPCSPQLGKARTQQRRPSAAKDK